MTFGASYWLWVLVLLPVFAFLYFKNEKRGKALLEKIVASRLIPQLAGSISHVRRRIRFFAFLLGVAFIIVSLARPQIGYTWVKSKSRGRDVLIAIDTSKSMLSTDVAPNRLTRAKLAAQDLIERLQGDRAGLIAFAGDSFLQAPLTVDYGAVTDSIDDLDTNTIPLGGTDIASVINEAAKDFGDGESDERCLVLFTDGEELSGDAVEAAKSQAGKFRIFTVGVGTSEGSLIPVTGDDGGVSFVKGPDGEIVKSKLDEPRLKEIAKATGGFYTHLQNGPEDMKKIVQTGLGEIKQHEIDVRTTRRPIERYQWPLALGLILVAASTLVNERRRTVARAKRAEVLQGAVVLLTICASLHSLQADSLNAGIELYNNKKYKESYEEFNSQLQKNPDSQALDFDSGAAAYKSGDYDKAIDAFAKAIASPKLEVQGKSEYNLGNALCLRGVKQDSKDAKLKDWNNAIQHYDQALKIDPKNEDAKYNRDVVKKLIEDLEKQPPKSQQNQQDQNNKEDQQKQQGKSSQQNQQNQQGQNNQQNQQNQQGQNNQQNQQGQNNQQNQQNQQGQNNQQNQQNQQGQNQNQQPGQQNPSPDNGNGSPQYQTRASASLQPTPGSGEAGKTLSGKIKENQQQTEASQAAAAARIPDYAPGQERQMTPEEALRIVESEKDEEAKGVLNEQKTSAAVLRDW